MAQAIPASMNKEVAEIQQLLKRECPDVRHLFRTSTIGTRVWSEDVQAGFGHRGGNQPVKEVVGRGVEITSHNHGFAVSARQSAAGRRSHAHQSQRSVRRRHAAPHLPIISVQYHPEAAPALTTRNTTSIASSI
jgi:carbamoyl-phosphate synthase small subunit